MVERTHLPVGSVVKVKGSKENYSIISLFPVTNIDGELGYFDFGAAELPGGMIGKEAVFFNIEDIEELVFIGYIDAGFQQLIANYDEIVSGIPYPKWTIEDLAKKGLHEH